MSKAPDKVKRDILPIPDQQWVGLTTYDAKDPNTKYPPIEPLRPPAAAPNVLVVLIDDVGFGASSAFGGPCHTPTAERLAANGLKYNRFHTTALCSPTRQAMLTGRNGLLRRRGLRRRRGHRLALLTGVRSPGQQVHRRDQVGALDIGDDDHDHLITPEERFSLAMARQ